MAVVVAVAPCETIGDPPQPEGMTFVGSGEPHCGGGRRRGTPGAPTVAGCNSTTGRCRPSASAHLVPTAHWGAVFGAVGRLPLPPTCGAGRPLDYTYASVRAVQGRRVHPLGRPVGHRPISSHFLLETQWQRCFMWLPLSASGLVPAFRQPCPESGLPRTCTSIRCDTVFHDDWLPGKREHGDRSFA